MSGFTKQDVPNGNSKEGNTMSKTKTVEEWLEIRKQAGLEIDAAHADVDWNYALTLDPYGVLPVLPEEYQQVGGHILHVRPEATYGSGLEICLKQPEPPFGKGMERIWHSQAA